MIFRVPDHVDARSVDDEVILFDAQNGGYLGLNPSGTAVWYVLTSGRPVADAVEELITQFDVDRATAEEDVTELLQNLRNLDLISPLKS